MRLGIFGGTFDPPHIAHLILAAEAHDQLQLDRVLWVLTPNPPHKPGQPITPVETRLEMVQACIQDAPAFELSRVDMDRPPPHYAVDTVQLLQKAHPDDVLIYVMGGDSLLHLHTWHKPLHFIQACAGIGVIQRSDEEIDLAALDARLPGLAGKVQIVNSMVLGISSSEIRLRAAASKPIRYYLHPGVFKLIQNKGLYQDMKRGD
jgi:nicotinate-nucleotide adenylyltransferase